MSIPVSFIWESPRGWWQVQFALRVAPPPPTTQGKVKKLLSFYVFMLYPIFQTLTPKYTLLCLKGYLEIICSLIWGSFETLYSTLWGFSATLCMGGSAQRTNPSFFYHFCQKRYPLPMTSINKLRCLFHISSNNKSVLSSLASKKLKWYSTAIRSIGSNILVKGPFKYQHMLTKCLPPLGGVSPNRLSLYGGVQPL